MDSAQLGAIAYDINMRLIKQGLNDAEISFIGMCLLSYSVARYSVAQTATRIMEGKKS